MSNEIPSKYTSFQESISMFDEESRYRPPTDSEPSIYYISSDKPGLRWDGAPIRIITEITAHTREHPSSQYLDEPLFKYDQGDIYPSDNRLINSEDCNPVFLVNLVDRLADRDMPYPEEIRQDVIEGVRGVFLEGATPRMFYNNVSDHANLIFKDDVHPETYRATPELFFGSMANKNILAFDIHDLLHHPLQLATWPEQFQYVSKAAYIAQTLPKDFTYRERLQKLTELTWLATFEESLITTNDQLVSFGCLNWLAPSETPFDRVSDIRELSVEEQKIAYRWHYLDALKDMYRIQATNSKLLGKELEWLRKLGYNTDANFEALFLSDEPRPFENLDYYDALRFDIQTPESPEELFANAIQLIEEEFQNAQG